MQFVFMFVAICSNFVLNTRTFKNFTKTIYFRYIKKSALRCPSSANCVEKLASLVRRYMKLLLLEIQTVLLIRADLWEGITSLPGLFSSLISDTYHKKTTDKSSFTNASLPFSASLRIPAPLFRFSGSASELL